MIKFMLVGQFVLLSLVQGQPPPHIEISTDLNDVNFILWTPESGLHSPFTFDASTPHTELLNHGFNLERPTKVISHGWRSNGYDFADLFVEAYFTHSLPEYNVIAINWELLATWDSYFTSATNAVRVGGYSAEVLGRLLIAEIGQNPAMIHAIGHSLGGHLVGHFGRTVEKNFGQGKISRVTALDPAGPWFDFAAAANRIAKTDARFVDVIHSNSGTILELCLSYPGRLGHVDYYPNGGSHQEGCIDVCMASHCTEWNLIDLFNGACSHMRVNDLYVESIILSQNSQAFLSTQCDSWENFQKDECNKEIKPIAMGEGLSQADIAKWSEETEIAGTFFLTTKGEPPFSGFSAAHN